MTSRKNSKTTGKAGRYAAEQPTGGIRKFFQRLCIYGLTLIGMLLIYFVMGGDSKNLIGVKNSDETQPNQTANSDGFTHSVGKPAMDENGNPIRKVSDDSDMFGSELDEMLGTGGGSSGSETSPETDYGSEYGSYGSDSSYDYNSGSSGEESPMVGSSGSESGNSSGETSGSSSDSSGSYGSDHSSGSGSNYSSGSGSDYSSGSGSNYSSGSGSDYSNGSGSNYSSGSGSDYSSGSGSNYSSGSDSSYSSSSGSGYAGSSSYDSSTSLNTGTSSTGANVDTSKESLDDFFPKTQPIKNYKEGVVTGPDGNPRRDEVKILEVGRGEPVKNHFGPAVTDFLDLFDFSITPDWIEANWSSVAIVGPLTTRGYRVPISTGPEPSDLVGSLTYYFDNRLELEKITFEGYTGDLDRLLISLKYYNLTKRITSDPSALLYLSEPLSDNRRSFLKSYFRLQSHDKNEPNKRYWLTIELYPPEK